MNAKTLCFVIITANRSESVEGNLAVVAKAFFKCGIDVYIYDSSDSEDTKYVVDWYSRKFDNVKYIRWNGKFDGKSIDQKVIDAYKYFSSKYEYVWLSREGTPINIGEGYKKIFDRIKNKFDIIVLNAPWRDIYFTGEKNYCSCTEFFKEQCHQMTILGVTILRSIFLKKVLSENPLNKEKNYGIWQPISFFYTISHTAFKASCIEFNLFLPNNKAHIGSFWHKKILWQWGERWYKVISYLPDCYNSYKENILHFRLIDCVPFSLESICKCKVLGGLTLLQILRNKKYLKFTCNTHFSLFFIISLLPKCLVKVLLKFYSKCRNKNAYNQINLNMKNYLGKRNFDNITNNFNKTKNIDSIKLYEDNKVSDPFITIVIPTYKRVDLLKEALNSVINLRNISSEWDLLIIDNEQYDGKQNETEKYLRTLNLNRITYYRNSNNIRPADNFNRGIYLARAPWIMMLHDDDLLTPDALWYMERSIKFLTAQKGKPLGAISASYYQFNYSHENKFQSKIDIKKIINNHLMAPVSYKYYKLDHANILFTGHIGGSVPSNGSIYNRDAFIKTGGFNEDNGIMADLILFYNMENNYSVYQSLHMTGCYRRGENTMSLPSSSYQVISNGFSFREYVFSKNIINKIYGYFLRSTLYYIFTGGVLEQRAKSFNSFISFSDFSGVYNKKPNRLILWFYKKIINKIYLKIKKHQIRILRHKAESFFKQG